MARFEGLHVAILAADGVEEAEIVKPLEALRKEGAHVDVISLQDKPIQAVRHMDKGARIPTDRRLQDARPEEFDALVLPGGAVNADALRTLPDVQNFVRSFDEAGKPIAVICHAPWLLASAGLLRGRTLTSYHTIQDDVRNAGGHWVDREVVEDRNWVTSRQPSDIPAFLQTFFAQLDQLVTVAQR
jgi:protease I